MQRRTASGSYQTVAALDNALSYLDTGLTANTVYYYRVGAANYAGQSAFSAEANATTLSSGSGVPLDGLKLWLKADCGHGANPVNYWSDQSTNGNSAYFGYGSLVNQPIWVGAEMNGNPAIHFQGTNGFNLPFFATGWTVGEAFVVVKALGSRPTQRSGLWLICAGSLPSGYPEYDGQIRESFGRTNSWLFTGRPGISLTNAHLYNVMSNPTDWFSKLNNQMHYSVTNNTGGFDGTTIPRLGWGSNVDYFRGYISEVLIYNRQLTATERDAVADSYLRRRFNLY